MVSASRLAHRGHAYWTRLLFGNPHPNEAGLINRAIDPETGKIREYCREKFVEIELDRFNCDYVSIRPYTRKHWWKPAEDRLKPEEGIGGGYTWVPSDDFSDWQRNDEAWIAIPAKDIIKLAELIQAAQSDWLKIRKTKNHLNFMERIAKGCGIRWIGVNSSYEEIKWTYSNERLRQERAKKEGSNNAEI